MLEALAILAGSFLVYAVLAWIYPPLLRLFFCVIAHGLYRLRVYNRERIPKTGGRLIVCNHASYVDWLLLWVACPGRVTTVLWGGYYRNPILSFFLSWGRQNTIRIDNRTNRPNAVKESLKKIAAALDAGRLVVIFPEGRLTRIGNMLPFGRGIELVLRMTITDVVVIPTCTSGLWGGFFSHGGGRIMRKLPRAFRPRVCIWFGQPLKKGLSAAEYRLAVQECMAELAIHESVHILPVHRRFVRNAAKFRNIFRKGIIDNATGPRTLTWGKTLAAALCVTNYLRPRLGDAANVGLWLPTSLGGALANVSITFLGKTSVNLNYTVGAGSVRSAISQAGIRTIITSKRFLMRAFLEIPEGVQVIYLEDVLAAVTKWQQIRAFLKVLFLPGWVIDRFLLGLHRHKSEDPLTIVFSSGSTGEPKGVVLSHRNVAHNVESSVRTIGIEKSDRVFGAMPFFHSFGFTVCLWAPLVAECTAVWYPDPRSAKEMGELARKYRTTLLLSTATFLRFYIRRCGADDFRTVRLLICGAEKLPVKLQDEFRAKFGVLPLEGYGCTELSPVIATNLYDISVRGVVQKCNERGTVGQPIFGVCVRSFSADDAPAPLPIGVEGALCVKGPNVMAGYLGQPEKTAEVIRDGWYNTGDMGHIEPDGFVRITGRMSRFAKIAGEMVPLERLDEELHDALGSNDERVLAVTAVPDDKRGERIVVLYLPAVGERLPEALDSLGKRGLPNLWVPDSRDCHTIDAMPCLGSGKLDLRKLGDMARELAAK
jgi:acyl-[acyl-carrier-protein]-phospholipid O-acyltransferase / long-chain-fatty-acid--[acyl-carrier-protein] ligase